MLKRINNKGRSLCLGKVGMTILREGVAELLSVNNGYFLECKATLGFWLSVLTKFHITFPVLFHSNEMSECL